MSNIKNLLFDYAMRAYLEPDHLTENELLKLQTQILLDSSTHCYDKEVAEFFEALFDNACHENYWLMINDSDATYNLQCDSVSELIDAACTLSQFKYNIYFAPNAFRGWRKDDNVVSAKSIFIDIDDIDEVDFSIMTTYELTLWLMETYDIPEELLPNWCVCSGHGLHLYYIIDKLDLMNEENQIIRRQFTDYLIAYFGADKACRNSSRVLRVPKSYNVKHEERVTTLHHMNSSDNYDLMRLYYFYRPQHEIDDYMKECQERKNAKSRATREQNQQEREGTRKKEAVSKPKHTAQKIAAPLITASDQERLQGMSYYTNFDPKARYWNIIKDLHNFYLRDKGQLYRRRNLFFLIMSTYLRNVMPLEGALEFLDKYITDDIREETIKTVEHVYQREQNYRFRNTTIAELLGFTKEDIKKSYCNFSQERIDKARRKALKQSNRKLAEKRKKERAVQDNRTFIYIAVKDNHANLTVKQLADYCGVSESTIKRMRKKIREEND